MLDLTFKKLKNIILRSMSCQKQKNILAVFTIQQPKEKGSKVGLSLLFIDSVHFLNSY